jgi:hypothetical protein
MRCLHGTPRRCRKRIGHRTGREVAQKAAYGTCIRGRANRPLTNNVAPSPRGRGPMRLHDVTGAEGVSGGTG